jgi:hypothetical protein
VKFETVQGEMVQEGERVQVERAQGEIVRVEMVQGGEIVREIVENEMVSGKIV